MMKAVYTLNITEREELVKPSRALGASKTVVANDIRLL
jgi:hypothetical protein